MMTISERVKILIKEGTSRDEMRSSMQNSTQKYNPAEVTFEDIARDMNATPEQVLLMLKEEGIFDGNNIPYPVYVEQGYFKATDVLIPPVRESTRVPVPVITLLFHFSEVVKELSPDNLKLYFKVIYASTPMIERKNLLRRVVYDLLVVLREQAKEQMIHFATIDKSMSSINKLYDQTKLQFRNEFDRRHFSQSVDEESIVLDELAQMLDVLDTECRRPLTILGVIGELAYFLLNLFGIVASDEDYATLLGTNVENIIYAREQYLLAHMDFEDYECGRMPSLGDIVCASPLEEAASIKILECGPLGYAINEAHESELTDYSRYFYVINILAEMIGCEKWEEN